MEQFLGFPDMLYVFCSADGMFQCGYQKTELIKSGPYIFAGRQFLLTYYKTC